MKGVRPWFLAPARARLGMFKRLFFLAIMMGAVGLPYLLSSSGDWWGSFTGHSSGGGGGKGASTAPSFGKTGASKTTGGTLAGPTTPRQPAIEGFGAQDLGEVLTFNGTPAWVMARWPRVTAGLATLDLQGYRVPLVTGTSAGDLAGSLTYYFDKNQVVSYITFHGTTGDPRKLVALVMHRYSFVPQKSDDPGLSLYQVRWNGKPLSELRIRTASVVRADQPRGRTKWT